MPVGELRQQRGFTLIELLVTLIIATIIAILAVPAFTGFLARQHLASEVNEIISVLSFARSEAIKQRTDISVNFSPSNAITSNRRPESCRDNEIAEDSAENSQESARYRYSGGCYWVTNSVAPDEILRVGQSTNISSPEQEFSLTFQSLGDADISSCPDSPCEMTLKATGGSASTSPVTLVIRTTGSIRRKESES